MLQDRSTRGSPLGSPVRALVIGVIFRAQPTRVPARVLVGLVAHKVGPRVPPVVLVGSCLG